MEKCYCDICGKDIGTYDKEGFKDVQNSWEIHFHPESADDNPRTYNEDTNDYTYENEGKDLILCKACYFDILNYCRYKAGDKPFGSKIQAPTETE